MIFIIFAIHTFLADGHIAFLSIQAVCFSADLSGTIYFSSSYLFILIMQELGNHTTKLYNIDSM